MEYTVLDARAHLLSGARTSFFRIHELSINDKNMTDPDEIADGFNKYYAN